MDDLEPCYMSATELASAIRAKAVSPVEVVTAILARIDTLEPQLNAFATLTPELAVDATRRAEKAVMAGDMQLGRRLNEFRVLPSANTSGLVL